MVNGGINKARVNMHTEFADGNDAKRIAKNAKRYDSQGKQGALPRRAKEELAGDEAGDEEDEAGTDATALQGHLETEARELKLNSVPEQRGAGEAEEQFRGVGRAMLQERFDGISDDDRKRDQEDQKPKRKCERAQGLPTETKATGADEQEEERERVPGKRVHWGELQPGMKGKESEAGEQTGGEGKRGELAVALGEERHRIPPHPFRRGEGRGEGSDSGLRGANLEPGQVEADEGDQEDVRIELAMEGKPGKGKQRFGEADRQDHAANRQKPELASEQRGECAWADGGRGGDGFGDQGSGGVVEWGGKAKG